MKSMKSTVSILLAALLFFSSAAFADESAQVANTFSIWEDTEFGAVWLEGSIDDFNNFGFS